MTPRVKAPAKSEVSLRVRGRRWTARLLAAALLLAAIASGGYALWRAVRPQVLAGPQFIVTAAAVSVTPPPPWIRSDVKEDVVRDINLAGPISVLDEDLGERFYEAFAAQPWVAKVVRVLKRPPAGVDVEVVYRKPVLMVKVPDGLLPVDGDAVQLPTADFSPLEASHYPRLVEIEGVMPPPSGTRWSERRVVAAAALAAVLVDAWQELGLHYLAVAPESAGLPAGSFEFELFTKGGTRVAWGLSPAGDDEGRAASADKLSRLRHYASEHGTLDNPRTPQNLDVRAPQGVVATPRTAARFEKARESYE